MLINAELLLQYQRCKRRPFLDIHGDRTQRDKPTDLLIKLQQDKSSYQKSILKNVNYIRPIYGSGDWRAGVLATLELMEQGVDCIYQGILTANYTDIEWNNYPYIGESIADITLHEELQDTFAGSVDTEVVNDTVGTCVVVSDTLQVSQGQLSSVYTKLSAGYQESVNLEIPLSRKYTLLSCPDLLIKQPGKSRFGDWIYVPATIELGKRPKQEYQVVAAYHAQVLKIVQGVEPDKAWLVLRGKESGYVVDLRRWLPQMLRFLAECVQSLESPIAPDVFISRQKCTLCHWHSDCYTYAKARNHLSLLPGVTPVRYSQLQALDITSPLSLANANPSDLENLPGFDSYIAPKIVIQAKSIVENRPYLLPDYTRKLATVDIEFDPLYVSLSSLRPNQVAVNNIRNSASIELYFDIEAQPDLELHYLLGVLVVDKQANTEKFYSLIAERPEDERIIWQQFLDLVNQYPDAPIYHFCVYEFDTVKRLAKLYRTPSSVILPVLSRFVDVYEELIHSVTLPVESYALKAIAKWLGFEWRDSDASGAKCIYWYDQWLETGERALLEIIQRYNEDDCRATRSVKDWLVEFLEGNR